ITQLPHGVPKSTNAAYHARIVRDRASMRLLERGLAPALRATRTPGADLREVLTIAREALSRAQVSAGSSSSFAESLPDVYARVQDAPARVYLIDQLIGAREITLVAGPERSGKTWLVNELLVAIATGTPAF